jgi:GH15 family glucan-1,4-alpha-glucosidase
VPTVTLLEPSSPAPAALPHAPQDEPARVAPARRPGRDASGYAPISDYGFLSDCRSSALVSSDGAIDWLCWPRFDSPALFAAILDAEHGGTWRIRPVGEFTVTRSYLPSTNVVQTAFHTATGTVRLTDWLHIGARQALCRRLHGLEGEVALELVCDPRPGFNADGRVSWEARMGWLVCCLPSGERLVADGIAGPCERRVVRAGEIHDFSLSLNRPGPSDLASSLGRTVEFWVEWCEELALPPEHAELVRRSALVLKGLQYQPTGAIVAAPTTSLPECVGGTRNWDYRFSWLRDATLTLAALAQVNKDHEAQSWLDWLKMITLVSGVEELQIMYGIGGEAELPERLLHHLEGHKGSSPVRVGNSAALQRQIDTYGELADAIFMVRDRAGERLNSHRWRLLRALAQRAEREWREPDEGIWEVRGEPRHFVHSKVMCWVALDRAIRVAELDGFDDAPLARWRGVRDQIRAQVLARGYDARLGAFTQSYGSGTLDASNLILASVGFIAPHDPRFVGTVHATGAELNRGGLIDRYKVEDTDDGFGGQEEGTFSICTFWYACALIQIGDVEEAHAVFTRVSACANDLGLLAEELTPDGEQLGNFPQAFTHIALINCAFALAGAARGSGELAA